MEGHKTQFSLQFRKHSKDLSDPEQQAHMLNRCPDWSALVALGMPTHSLLTICYPGETIDQELKDHTFELAGTNWDNEGQPSKPPGPYWEMAIEDNGGNTTWRTIQIWRQFVFYQDLQVYGVMQWHPLQEILLVIHGVEKATNANELRPIWKGLQALGQRPGLVGRGGPKPTPIEKRLEIVKGWLEVEGEEIKEVYAQRQGCSTRTLTRWEKDLRDLDYL